MAELSTGDLVRLSRMTGDMMTLLLLDDAWTEFARKQVPPYRPDFPEHEITEEMAQLLNRMGDAADLIGSLPQRMGPDLQARFDALMWGDGLSTIDRDDLRWLVTRAGGVAGLAQSAAAALSNYAVETNILQEQVQRVQSGGTVAGDLSPSFRCGLGTGLLVGGAAALPAAASAGAAAAFTAGAAGAIAAGVVVGATGGIGAIALVVAGILVMRRQKC